MHKKPITNMTAFHVKNDLSCRGISLASLARELNVSLQIVSQVLYTPDKSAPTRRAIVEVLGYHPWPQFAERDGWSADGTQPPAPKNTEAQGSTPAR